MGDTPPKPSDDEAFFAGLDALDRGLAAPPRRVAPRPADVPEPDAPSVPPLDRAGAPQDPLGVPEILDLYPPPRPNPSRQGSAPAGRASSTSRPVRSVPPPPPAPSTLALGRRVASFGAEPTARSSAPASRTVGPPFDAGFVDAAGRPRFDDDVLEDLPAESARRPFDLRDSVVLGVGALALMLMGAAGGAYLFQERIALAVQVWIGVPAPPAAPGVTAPMPIRALPVPSDDPAER